LGTPRSKVSGLGRSSRGRGRFRPFTGELPTRGALSGESETLRLYGFRGYRCRSLTLAVVEECYDWRINGARLCAHEDRAKETLLDSTIGFGFIAIVREVQLGWVQRFRNKVLPTGTFHRDDNRGT